MEAILILLAVHTNNPKDIPGRVEITFPTMEQCERAKSTIEYELKFKQFKLDASCQRKS